MAELDKETQERIASQTVTAPFLALAWTITYYELRAIKEPTPAVAA